MADTFRNILGIDKAGQKDLWDRPLNPSQQKGNMRPTGDTKTNKSTGKDLPATKSLND